jgi:hypothetical protein
MRRSRTARSNDGAIAMAFLVEGARDLAMARAPVKGQHPLRSAAPRRGRIRPE